MIGMYVFMLSSLLISRKAVEISHTHVENCMYARAGLDFVSCHEPTKWSQPGGWQPPQPPQKVATSIYCIIIQPFSSHLFLAHIRLIWPRRIRWYKWCNWTPGWGPKALRLFKIDRVVVKKMRWLELVCWNFCYLAGKRMEMLGIKLARWQNQ